jgi:hypothetical protein
VSAAVVPQDTVVPDSFSISQTIYTTPPGATNVEITVAFQPGNRGYSGAVDFHTEDDTASDGVDYLGASGRLYFSGVPEKTFNIPILPSSSDGRPKSFRVYLTHTTAYLWNSPATVLIEHAPRLECSTKDGKLVLSWPGNLEGYILESSPYPDCSSAMQVPLPAVVVDGRWQVEEAASAAVRFYRLRKL